MPRRRRNRVASAAALIGALASCTYVQPPALSRSEPHLVPLDATECHAVLNDDASPESLRQALVRSADYLEKLGPNRTVAIFDQHFGGAALSAMLRTLNTSSDVAQQVCDHARVYRAQLPDPLLVTGYYEPELPASRTRSERFRYPIYRTPQDIVDVDLGQFCPQCGGRVTQGRIQNGTLIPYYSRGEIDAGALQGRDLEIAWLDDPIEAYFLHVQGSAVLRFDDGVYMHISYSSSNGRGYTSIGRLLIDRGKLTRAAASLPTLKAYLRAHPDEQSALMNANARYIFFRAVVAGPIGSVGVPLTAGRSVAADAAVYPPGALAFLRTDAGDARSAAGAPPAFSRFVLIQDAGVAITGPDRLDLFAGSGATAEIIAGQLRDSGELYFVLPQ